MALNLAPLPQPAPLAESVRPGGRPSYATDNIRHVLVDVADDPVAVGAEVIGISCNTAYAPSIFGIVRERLVAGPS